MREVIIRRPIPGEWDVISDKFTPRHFSDWDELVKFVGKEFDVAIVPDGKIDLIYELAASLEDENEDIADKILEILDK